MKNTNFKYKLNFKTMKKGLLTLLAASLVFVGCQNYDDQFDDLNAQISALKSQVDGLSSLSGQVASLSGSISGLQSGIAASASSAQMTALSASLSALQAEVDAIEAAIATTATAAEVTALQASLTAVEADLDDLLVSNNVYSTAVTINDAASMASALALGNKVALMNAAVSITDNAAIADADIQTFINRIKTMNAAFTYDSGSATGAAPTFDEMTSSKAITLTIAGDISFKKLASATTIEIHDDYETKITSVDFGALASVTTITTDEGGTDDDNALNMDSATNIDLGALALYGAALDIKMKTGGTLDISSLDDVNSAGTQTDIALTITGPDSLTLSKIGDGTITLTNVATATISGFYGTLDIKSGVKTLTTTDTVFIDLDSASSLETATLDFANDYDPLLSTANAAKSAAGNSSTYTESLSASGTIAAAALKTLTITGNLLDLYIDEDNLETVTVNASIDDLTITSGADLTTINVPSTAKINDITISDNTNLGDLTLSNSNNFTAHGTTAQTSVTYSITGNTSMTSLTTNVDDIGSLTVTGNTSLETVNFANLVDFGGATEPVVNIYNNKLTATSATDSSDGDTDVADGKSGNLGSYNSGTSGMKTLKTYLTAVAAEGDSDAYVSFDTVSTFQDTESTSTTTTLNVSYTNTTTFNAATVLYDVEQVASGGGSATKGKRGFLLDVSVLESFQVWANGAAMIDAANDGAPAVTAELAVAGNTAAVLVGLINQSQNLSRATNNGLTMLASAGGNSTVEISLGATLDSTLWETSNATASAIAMSTTETITLTVGNFTVNVAPAGTESGGEDAYADSERLVTLLRTAANTLATGDSANYYEVSIGAVASSTISGEDAAAFVVTSKDIGTGGAGLAASLSITGKSSQAYLPYRIGATRSTGDNVTAGPDVVLTFEWNTAGTDTYPLGTPANDATDHAESAATVSFAGAKATGTAVNELYSTYLANAGTNKPTGTNTYPAESRSDVTVPEQTIAATVTTAAVDSSHVHWLD